ncbi:MAG: DEAD/DEAH box helicase [Spirochaetota bacterium]
MAGKPRIVEARPPRKRGRPPKNPASIATPTAQRSIAASRGTVPALMDRPVSEKYAATTDVFFRLSGSGLSTTLDLVDRADRPIKPDFRRFAGPLREAVRAFEAELKGKEGLFRWDSEPSLGGTAPKEGSIVLPNTRLIDLVLGSGRLVDEKRRFMELLPEETGLGLDLEAVPAAGRGAMPAAGFSATLALGRDAQDAIDASAGDPEDIVPITPVHVRRGSRVYRVRDLGTEWHDVGRLAADVPAGDLDLFLSLALSRFPGITVNYENYVTMQGPPRLARPALLFREVDSYGYLHVRPISILPGYPPGFLEDEEISLVAERNEEEHRLLVSEILFPRFADEEFRALLAREGKAAKAAVLEESGHFILEGGFAEHFIASHITELVGRFTLLQSETLSAYRIKTARPRLRLNLSSGIDFLSGSASVEIDGELFTYADFLKRFHENSYVTLADGTRAYPEAEAVSRLERVLRMSRGEEGLVEVSFFDWPTLSRLPEVQAEGEAWKRPEEFYRGFNGIAERPGDFPVEGATLRHYQEFGVRWMDYLREQGLAGCLADEMGLGKTIQTIALLRAVHGAGAQAQGKSRGRKKKAGPGSGGRIQSLIVMPRSLLFNWASEFSRFAPGLAVALYHGTDRDAEALGKADIVLTSYAIARNDVEVLLEREWCYLVLDESQTIKNAGAKTTAAILRLRARHRLALSGTPMENNISEIYSLFTFLNPGMFGSLSEFLKHYQRPIQERQDEDALRDLKARIYPFILRRLKKDVLPELPEKTEQVSWIDLDARHFAAYEKRRLELKAEIDTAIASGGIRKSSFLILTAFSELRRLASVPEAGNSMVGRSAKRESLLESLREVVDSGHKCLVFTNYIAGVEYVSEDLAALGIGHLTMTGATTDRATLVSRFQSDPEIKVFIMTLKTGGLGLNLTAADYVFIFDPWWNRSAESQAIDRTHRMGQKNPVFCYRLIAKGTIEERMLELQEKKAGLVGSLLSSDAEAFKALDEADIEYLLG